MKAFRGKGFRVLYDVIREPKPLLRGTVMRSGSDVLRWFKGTQAQGIIPQGRECFAVMLLTTRHNLIGLHIASVGSLASTVVHPREVFRMAITLNAAAIIVAHNHPSGDCTPSDEDRKVTERLTKAGELLGIQVLDHLVIGDHSFYSFSDGMHQPCFNAGAE